MPQPKQRVLMLGFFLPMDKPELQKTPKLLQQYARPDQEVTTARLSSLFVSWDGKSFEVTDPTGVINLLDFDVVHIVDWSLNTEHSYAVAHYLQAHGIPTSNPSMLESYPDSKIGEMTRLCLDGITYPRSFYAGRNEKIVELYQWAHATHGLEFPIIVKGTTAAMGEDNFLVKTLDELTNLALRADMRYIMQEYIPNDCDYRVLVIGGTVITVLRRTRVDNSTHVNNTSQGAQADVIPLDLLPPTVVELAIKAAHSMHRPEHAGVDVLFDVRTNTPYVLEVNKRPSMVTGRPEVVSQKLSALYDYIATL